MTEPQPADLLTGVAQGLSVTMIGFGGVATEGPGWTGQACRPFFTCRQPWPHSSMTSWQRRHRIAGRTTTGSLTLSLSHEGATQSWLLKAPP